MATFILFKNGTTIEAPEDLEKQIRKTWIGTKRGELGRMKLATGKDFFAIDFSAIDLIYKADSVLSR